MASNPDEQEGNEDGGGLQVVLEAPLHFQSFQEYRGKELFADLCIKCDGKLYSAHSPIVAAASPPICKLLKSDRVQRRLLRPRCRVEVENLDESFLSGSQNNQHQQFQRQQQTTSRSTLSLIDVLFIDPAKKVSGFSAGKSPLSKKPNPQVDPARWRKDPGDASDGCCVTGADKESQSRIAMAVTVCGNGSLTLIVEGVDQEIMDLCIRLMYRESFRIKKCLVPKFISVSRSLELLGFESIGQQLEMHLQGIPALFLHCVRVLLALCHYCASGEQAPGTIAFG
ncbi:uncharacterized protein [Macrobrachium rosenbergii]|uniref:uncharacterized protein n=1 Tax=Macrobrachium rosenbergii TaxID=79674 RepID=UPI0034D3A5E4